MARMDAFSAQIVKFVRGMPDEALLELVRQKLQVSRAPSRRGVAATLLPTSLQGADKAKKGGKQSTASARRRAAPSAERRSLLDKVERVVTESAGVSASEVARLAALPQTRAAAALKELKLAKRIFQGGDRRFARYAADAKTAEQASATARKTAKGPVVKARKPASPARPRKRARASAT